MSVDTSEEFAADISREEMSLELTRQYRKRAHTLLVGWQEGHLTCKN